jgi:RNA polymerase sigma-70 factor (ECF subfamily)
MSSESSDRLQSLLERLRGGEAAAREELMRMAGRRLLELTRAMLRSYGRLKRWEDTDDVFQGAALRLHRALEAVAPATPRDFYRLATTQIRRELIDLGRHYFGPAGHGRHLAAALPGPDDSQPAFAAEPADASLDPARLSAWTEFHQRVEALPGDEQEVFSLIWYQGLTQVEAAELLGVSARTVLRRWQSACLALHDLLRGLLPEA